jgi:hypothetical protein
MMMLSRCASECRSFAVDALRRNAQRTAAEPCRICFAHALALLLPRPMRDQRQHADARRAPQHDDCRRR